MGIAALRVTGGDVGNQWPIIMRVCHQNIQQILASKRLRQDFNARFLLYSLIKVFHIVFNSILNVEVLKMIRYKGNTRFVFLLSHWA